MKAEVEWQGLTDTARGMLRHVAHLLAENFTGQIQMECNDGGIRDLTVTHKMQPSDLPGKRKT